MMFFFFKILKKIEKFLSWRDLRRIPGVDIFYNRLWLPLCDLLYDRAKPKGIILINVQGNKMYLDTNDRGIAPMLLMEGGIEKYETELFKKMVKKGMVVVDIGANIGYYTLMAAKLVGKKGIVYAFEPEPSSYELLCKNIKVNGYTNVVPVQKAISNTQGRVKLWFDKVNLPCASFSKESAFLFSKGKVFSGEEEVETITLDEFFESTVKNNKVDFVKIDAQGAEGFVIDGSKKILKSSKNLKIFMEFWPEGLRNLGTNPLELLQKLRGYGFKIKRIHERKQILESMEISQLSKKIKPYEGFNLLLEK